jgi:hypothetical protein
MHNVIHIILGILSWACLCLLIIRVILNMILYSKLDNDEFIQRTTFSWGFTPTIKGWIAMVFTFWWTSDYELFKSKPYNITYKLSNIFNVIFIFVSVFLFLFWVFTYGK